MSFDIITRTNEELERYLKEAQTYGTDAVFEALETWRSAENDPEYPKGDAGEESAYQLNKVRKLLDNRRN